MLTRHLALVAETKSITAADLNKVAAALQKQVTRDFGPIWEIQATISAFSKLEDVPSDYWPILIEDHIKTKGGSGVHEDKNGQPFALVQFSSEWSLTSSHETLEMLADPFGNRLVAGKSPKPGQGRVNFLVEVCDPSEAKPFAYTVNGITVADFYTPHFFDPVTSAAVRYSYTGAVKKPRTIRKGGYLSWGVPETNEWFQQIWFNTPRPTFRSLGVLGAKRTGSLRAMIDRLTPTPLENELVAEKAAAPVVASAIYEEADSAAAARAKTLRRQITAIKGKG